MESCSCYRDSIIIETLKKFQPLIKKYTRKLDYDGAETDLIIILIRVLDKMPPLKEECLINGYIIKSLWNEYIRLAKKTYLLKKEVPIDLNVSRQKSDIDLDIKIDIQNALKILTKNQKKLLNNYSSKNIVLPKSPGIKE